MSAKWSWFEYEAKDFGTGLVLASDGAAVRIWLPNGTGTHRMEREGLLADLDRRGIAAEHNGSAGRIARRLERLFVSGEDVSDIPTVLPPGSPFRVRVLGACHRIPRGKCLSYAELAAAAGNARAVRAAGTAMATNPLPLVIPCHRVRRSDGSLGNYGGGVAMKERLLLLEGAL